MKSWLDLQRKILDVYPLSHLLPLPATLVAVEYGERKFPIIFLAVCCVFPLDGETTWQVCPKHSPDDCALPAEVGYKNE